MRKQQYNTPMKRNRWPWGFVFLYCLMIFRNSWMSSPASQHMSMTMMQHILPLLKHVGLSIADPLLFHFYIRKLAHFTEFAGLGFLVWTISSFKPLTRQRRWDCLLFLLLIPCLDEMIQLFIPGRSGTWRDICIDGAGFSCGLFLASFFFFLTRSLYALCYADSRK